MKENESLLREVYMTNWAPFWTDEVTIENGGRYPLLLNRFHDHMEEYLIKGIVSITDRLRYVSYCCWVIGDIEYSLKCKHYYEFSEAFRRREAALAVGTYLLKPTTKIGNYTIYGRDYMRGRVDDIARTYNTSFSVLPSNELGAYGQYYKGSLQNWGLTEITNDGIVHLTELGKKLYAIMDDTYKNCSYYKDYKGKKLVPGDVLVEWGSINQYDNITDNNHLKERNFFKNILFHMDRKNVPDGRRDTLMIYLDCIAEAERKHHNFDAQMVRSVMYYKKYVNVKGEIVEFNVSNFLQDTLYYWKIYHAHTYFRWWIEEYFKMFLRIIKMSPNGYSLSEVVNLVKAQVFNIAINKVTGKILDYYNMVFIDFVESIGAYSKQSEYLFEEYISINSESDSISHTSANMLMILATIYQEWIIMRQDSRYINIRMNYTDDFWFKDIMERIECYKNFSIQEVLYDILEYFIIPRHNMAMYEKRDLRRCWFTKSGDKYQYQSDSTSIWSDGKYRIIYNFLYDMGITNVIDNTIILTNEGKILYKDLRENYYEK